MKAPKLKASVALALPAKIQLVPPLGRMLHGLLTESGFPAAFADDVELVFEEAAVNVIKHAYGGNAGKVFNMEIEIDAGGIQLILKDKGPAFDPKGRPKADLQENIRLKKRGGLGLLLMHELMDKVEYKSGAKSGNTLVMTKRI